MRLEVAHPECRAELVIAGQIEAGTTTRRLCRPRRIDLSPSSVINSTSGSLIPPKDGDGFISAEIAVYRNPAFLQLRYPVFGFRSLVEPDRRCVGPSRAADKFPDTGPKNRPIAHGTGFATRNQFECRHAVCAQVEMSKDLMGIRERHHFGMGEGTVGGLNDVEPNGDESSRLGFEHGCAERSTGLRCDVGQRKSDDELHAIMSRSNGLLPAPCNMAGPRRKVKGRSGRTAGFHDGSESFNASRFFVTMASPFFVETSMPVAQTVRHSSRRPSFWSD